MPPADASVPGLAVERFEIASGQALRTPFSSLMGDAKTALRPSLDVLRKKQYWHNMYYLSTPIIVRRNAASTSKREKG
jgi:hypothetical protein